MRRFLFILLLMCILSTWVLLWYISQSKTPPPCPILERPCVNVHRNWWSRKASIYGHPFPLEKGVTLVLHGDLTKLYLLNVTMELWPGPVSMCIFIHSNHLTPPNILQVQQIQKHWGKRLTVILYSSNDTYPINILRNRAAQKVKTELAFMIDLDFLPDPLLYTSILDQYDLIIRNSRRVAFVIPAFHFDVDLGNATRFQFEDHTLPATKVEVVQLMKEKKLLYQHWGDAHASTDYSRWSNSTHVYEVSLHWNYEPYVVVSLQYVPLFDERFIVYGDDKTQWHRHLNFLKFQYFVLPTNFIIHLPHKQHVWAGKERSDALVMVNKWKKEFSMDLHSHDIGSTKTSFLVPWVVLLLLLW